jgi:hypothetical protein
MLPYEAEIEFTPGPWGTAHSHPGEIDITGDIGQAMYANSVNPDDPVHQRVVFQCATVQSGHFLGNVDGDRGGIFISKLETGIRTRVMAGNQ